MSTEQRVFRLTMGRALSGRDSHVENTDALAALDWKLAGARPDGVPHSVFQLVSHMTYWQEWVVAWLDGRSPKVPRHAAGSWPGEVAPASRREWERSVRRFSNALDALERCSLEVDPMSKHGKMTRLEMLHIIGSHTSYHIGEVVLLRQMLRAWPPPSGGVTWWMATRGCTTGSWSAFDRSEPTRSPARASRATWRPRRRR